MSLFFWVTQTSISPLGFFSFSVFRKQTTNNQIYWYRNAVNDTYTRCLIQAWRISLFYQKIKVHHRAQKKTGTKNVVQSFPINDINVFQVKFFIIFQSTGHTQEDDNEWDQNTHRRCVYIATSSNDWKLFHRRVKKRTESWKFCHVCNHCARENIPKRIKKNWAAKQFHFNCVRTISIYENCSDVVELISLHIFYIYSVLRLSGELPSARERESNMFGAFPMTTSTTLNSLACEHNFRLFESKKHLDTPRGAYFFFHNHRHLFSLLHNVRNVKLNKQAAVDEAASVFFNYYLLLSTAQYKRNVRRVRRSTEMLVTTLDIITLAIDSSRASVNPPMMTKHRRSEEQRGKTNFTRWHRAMMWKVSVELESRYTIISTTYLSHTCCRTWRSSLGGFTALTTHDDIALKFKTQLRPIWWLNGGVHIAQVWNLLSVLFLSSCAVFFGWNPKPSDGNVYLILICHSFCVLFGHLQLRGSYAIDEGK